jgi:hypothetical protein
MYTHSIQENQFLQKTLEDDTGLLNDLVNDLERINKNIQNMNDKNKQLREQILEVRKKINQEKDNIVKATMTLNNKSTELLQSTDDLVKVNKEYSDLVTEHSRARAGSSISVTPPSQPKSGFGTTIPPLQTNLGGHHVSPNTNTTSPFNPPGVGNTTVSNPNLTPVNTNFAFNNNSFNPAYNFDTTNNTNNNNNQLKQFNSNNNPLTDQHTLNRSYELPASSTTEQHSSKSVNVYVPETKNDVVYPGLESVQKHTGNNPFNFDNFGSDEGKQSHEYPLPNSTHSNHSNHSNPTTNAFPEYKTNDFDNFGFPEAKIDPFSQRGGDDIFKTSSANKFEKDPDWDF